VTRSIAVGGPSGAAVTAGVTAGAAGVTAVIVHNLTAHMVGDSARVEGTGEAAAVTAVAAGAYTRSR
jgi:hypothetical protein